MVLEKGVYLNGNLKGMVSEEVILIEGRGGLGKGGLFERKPEGDGFRRSDLNRGEGWSWKRGSFVLKGVVLEWLGFMYMET